MIFLCKSLQVSFFQPLFRPIAFYLCVSLGNTLRPQEEHEREHLPEAVQKTH